MSDEINFLETIDDGNLDKIIKETKVLKKQLKSIKKTFNDNSVTSKLVDYYIDNKYIDINKDNFISNVLESMNNYNNEGTAFDLLFNFKNSKLNKNIYKEISTFNNIVIDLDVIIKKYQKRLNEDSKYSKNKLINNTRITYNSQNKLLYFIRYKYNIIFSLLVIIILLATYIIYSDKNIEIKKTISNVAEKTISKIAEKLPDKLPEKLPDKLPEKLPDKLPTIDNSVNQVAE